jgi:hypothetical protein
MKHARKAAFALLGLGLCTVGAAQAVPASVVTYVYYSGAQPVGQSILYCNGIQQHWGQALLADQHNAVAVTYSCSSGNATRISYPTNLDPSVKANFCNTGICEVGPEPIPGAGELLPGLFSDQ